MNKLFRWLLTAFLLSVLLGIAAIAVAWFAYGRDLPDVETLRDVQLQVPLRVFTADRRLIGVFGEKRRIPVSIEETPDCMAQVGQILEADELVWAKLEVKGPDVALPTRRNVGRSCWRPGISSGRAVRRRAPWPQARGPSRASTDGHAA